MICNMIPPTDGQPQKKMDLKKLKKIFSLLVSEIFCPGTNSNVQYNFILGINIRITGDEIGKSNG